jgi:hypothetical protein
VKGKARKLRTEAFNTVCLNSSCTTFFLQIVLADYYKLSRIVTETKLCVSIRRELLRFLNEDIQEILRKQPERKTIQKLVFAKSALTCFQAKPSKSDGRLQDQDFKRCEYSVLDQKSHVNTSKTKLPLSCPSAFAFADLEEK